MRMVMLIQNRVWKKKKKENKKIFKKIRQIDEQMLTLENCQEIE